MFQEIIIKYFHPDFNVGMQDVRNAWLLNKPPVKLTTSIYRGNLVYRIPVLVNVSATGLLRKD